MKVLALAADNSGCGFYRLRAPAEEVAKLGVEITIDSNLEVNASKNESTGRIEVNEIYTDADLIVFQRPLDNAFSSAIKQAKRQGIATVVEIDDDFSFINKNNAAYTAISTLDHTGAKWVEEAARLADLVTVSTPQLSKYARHGRFSVLRNCVPDEIFNVPLNNKTDQGWPRIGWTGSVQTHPNDLQATKGAVSDILLKNNLNFNVIGDGLHVSTNLQLDKSTAVYATGWVDISLYYQYIASFLDIGIVPLELSPFNQAKSALKGLEYAALGVPFVASPTREYERMEAYGIGKTAKSPGDWRRHLQRMIDRPSETERIGRESRDRIKAEHTYSVNAPKWLEAWEKAIDYRKTHHE
jgi:glycosyltransferase involved in cell wall biosynthesis